MIVGIDSEVRSESWVAGASGFWLPVQVDSRLWVTGASGFWLCFLGLSCCVLWVWLSVF